MKSGAAFSGGEQARNGRHLCFRVYTDTTHHVVSGRSDFHRGRCDIDVGELFKLVIHAWQLPLDVLRRIGDFLFDPGDVEKDAAMRRAASRLDFAHDASRDVIARQQFGRPPCSLLALTVMPTLQFVVGDLSLIGVRNIVENESSAFGVAQNSAFPPHSFRD